MTTVQGKIVSMGIAIGKICFYRHERTVPHQHLVKDLKKEAERFYQARSEAIERLHQLYLDAQQRAGEQSSLIFQVHQAMLEDMDFEEAVLKTIRSEGKNAEYAVYIAAKEMSELISTLDDPYLQERSMDVIDSAYTLLDILEGRITDIKVKDGPVILAADNLMPSETLYLAQEQLLGFITSKGSINSHSAILARNMGVPAVTQLSSKESLETHNGELAILNGLTGDIIFSPDEDTLLDALVQQEEYHRFSKVYPLMYSHKLEKMGAFTKRVGIAPARLTKGMEAVYLPGVTSVSL